MRLLLCVCKLIPLPEAEFPTRELFRSFAHVDLLCWPAASNLQVNWGAKMKLATFRPAARMAGLSCMLLACYWLINYRMAPTASIIAPFAFVTTTNWYNSG